MVSMYFLMIVLPIALLVASGVGKPWSAEMGEL